MYDIKRTDDEIDEVLNKADHCVDVGSYFHGMSYEQGIVEAIRWLVGDQNDNPMGEFEIPDEDEE